MWLQIRPPAIRRVLLVLALIPLVYYWSAALGTADTKGRRSAGQSGPAAAQPVVVGYDTKALPRAVAEMRNAILAAVHSGEVEELRYAIELNELKPELGAAAGTDPITHLRTLSGDGEGRDILAILGELLDGGYAVIPAGRDIENNRVYVWPYFAEIPLATLSPAQQVDLYRLLTPAEAEAMRRAKKWTWWRLAIGADGVWLSFGR